MFKQCLYNGIWTCCVWLSLFAVCKWLIKASNFIIHRFQLRLVLRLHNIYFQHIVIKQRKKPKSNLSPQKPYIARKGCDEESSMNKSLRFYHLPTLGFILLAYLQRLLIVCIMPQKTVNIHCLSLNRWRFRYYPIIKY